MPKAYVNLKACRNSVGGFFEGNRHADGTHRTSTSSCRRQTEHLLPQVSTSCSITLSLAFTAGTGLKSAVCSTIMSIRQRKFQSRKPPFSSDATTRDGQCSRRCAQVHAVDHASCDLNHKLKRSAHVSTQAE